MAMSGTITQNQKFDVPLFPGGVPITKQIHWSAQKEADSTVVITCYYQVKADGNDAFYALEGTCTFTINGVDYSVNTPVTSAWCTDYKTPSVTSNPITIKTIDSSEQISITAKWNPEGSIGYFNNYKELDSGLGINSVIPSATSDYSTCSGSASIDPINKSTEIAITGTEIDEQSTIDIVNHRSHSGVTHSLSYTCKTASGDLFTNEPGDYINFTLPATLAERNKTGLDLSVTFTLTTHFPWGDSGSTTKTVIYNIPDKDIFKPHCNITVTDGEHRNNVQLVDKYGAFVKGYSRFRIVAEPVLAYGSEIVSITIKANDETHVDYYEVETELLKYPGEQNITVALLDDRGRSNEIIITKNVVDYLKPYVSNLRIDRCDSAGTIDSSGDHIKVTFDAEIKSLGNLNSATYKLEYMTAAGLDQHEITLEEFTGQYSIKGGTYKFKADSGNEYSVTLTATDDLDHDSQHEGSEEATTIWNAGAEGNSFAFGKISELPGVLENMFKFFPIGGFMFPKFEKSSVFNVNVAPNVYTVKDGQDIEESPFTGEYTLIVLPGGGVGDLLYIAISKELEVKINILADGSWLNTWKTLTVT